MAGFAWPLRVFECVAAYGGAAIPAAFGKIINALEQRDDCGPEYDTFHSDALND
jgi:hypothetical protein